MTIYKRSDMLYVYNWSADGGDNPKLKGEPDRSLFNRMEGYEVLYIINKFLVKNGHNSILSGNKAERLIYTSLPKGSHSQEAVMRFLEDKFS